MRPGAAGPGAGRTDAGGAAASAPAVPPRAAFLARAVRLAGALPHAAAIAAFVWLAALRFDHPLELGWVEGVLMDSIRRLAEGRPLYPAPTLDYIPLAYMPGYYLVAAPLVQALGAHLWVPRLLAILETLLAAALLARIVRRETGNGWVALAAPALFLGAFAFCGGSYDHVQPNSQLVLFTLAGALALRETRGVAGAVLAGASFGMAFLTKQHGLLLGLAMLPWLALHDRRRLAPYLLALAAFAGGGYLLLGGIYGPWFTFYTYDVPSHWSAFHANKVIQFAGYVFGVFGICAAAGALAVLPFARRSADDRGAWIWWWAAAGGVALGLLATLDAYSYRHTLMPMVTLFALVAPIAAWRIVRALTAGRLSPAWTAALVLWLLVPQYVPLLYPVRRYVPRSHVEPLRDRFYERLRGVPGRILLLNHGFYLEDAGRRPSLHLLALEDILRAKGNALLRRDPHYFDRQLAALASGPGRPWVLTDRPMEALGDHSNPWWRKIAASYAVRDSFPAIVEVELPLTGPNEAPRYLYEPVEAAR